MTLHTGAEYELDGVRISPPDAATVRSAPTDAGVDASVHRWLSRAEAADDVHYFAVHEGVTLVGQIFLHDTYLEIGEALVGYHLFERRFRGRGIGTTMLTLLQRSVREAATLHRLVVITGDDNVASQRIALKCGFVHTGPPREDPVHGMCFEWRIGWAVGEGRLVGPWERDALGACPAGHRVLRSSSPARTRVARWRGDPPRRGGSGGGGRQHGPLPRRRRRGVSIGSRVCVAQGESEQPAVVAIPRPDHASYTNQAFHGSQALTRFASSA